MRRDMKSLFDVQYNNYYYPSSHVPKEERSKEEYTSPFLLFISHLFEFLKCNSRKGVVEE